MSCADVQTIQAGNGAKTQFSFDFPYIFKSEIQVSFWNATTKEWDVIAQGDATYPWQVTDANPTIVEFTGTAPPAPAVPVDPNETAVDNVKIRRVTNIDDIRALFNPGSAIRSDDLNKNFEQLRYAIQEANCQGIPDDVDQYLKDYYWDRFDNTLYSADTWRSDDATIATTAALDQRFQDEVNDTFTKAELASNGNAMPNNDDAVPTTGAVNDYINEVITNDIGTDGTGITVTDDGDGTITLGLADNSIDFSKIKNADIITQAEQDADYDLTGDDNSIFTSSAAVRRFENFVQNNAPTGTGIGKGRVWVDPDDDLTLSVWNGTNWVGITSGGTFTNQPKVVYVDASSGDDANDGHRISRPKKTIKAAINQVNADATYGDGSVIVVAPGTYQEVAPLDITKKDVSIIGTALRSCVIHPTVGTETNSLFRVNSGTFLQNLTFTGVKASGTRGEAGSIDPDAVYGLPGAQGWNVSFYPGAMIYKSPYIQNCTNFSDSEIDNSSLDPHTPAGGAAGDTDSQMTGGGLLIDGSVVDASSPLRSMVCDSYTHVGLDGPGILVTNNGYAQCTSSYAFFNHYHIKCLNGGQANLAASTTDFGRYGLVVDGRSTNAIFTADTTATANDGDTSFTIGTPVAGSPWHGSATRPQSNMLVDIGGNTYPILSATPNGSGWDVVISRPDPSDRSINLGLDGAVASGSPVSFYLRSMIASSGHTMEYVGSGTNYSALPENGGVPIEANQVVELNDGKVWTAITDHNGKFKVGDFFTVDQQTNAIFISSGSFNVDLQNLQLNPSGNAVIGANLDLNGSDILDSTGNVTIADTLDMNSNGIINVQDPSAANHAATKNYVDNNALLKAGDSMTGALGVTLGTAASPSIYFDANTGIYSPGADQVAISTNGTGRLFVDASGNVGVGTASPSYNLQIKANTARLAFQPTADTQENQILFRNAADNATAGSIVYDHGNACLLFKVNSSERLRITSDGKLGLGTSTPSTDAAAGAQNLVIGNASSSTAGITINTGTGSYVGRINFGRGATDQTYGYLLCDHFNAKMQFGIDASTKMTLDSSGRLGIGTTNPSRLLQVSNTSADPFISILGAASSEGGLLFGDNASDASGQIRYQHSADAMYFATNATERMRIDSSGRVGIGTTSPSTRLHVDWAGGTQFRASNGSATFDILNDSTNSLLVSSGPMFYRTGTPGPHIFQKDGGSSEVARIDSSGRLLVGTSSTSANATLVLQGQSAGSNEHSRLWLSKGESLPASGSVLGELVFGDSGQNPFAFIGSYVDATPGSGDYPGRLVFSTTADNASSPTERMRIDSSGRVGIGTTSPSTKLHIHDGSGSSAQVVKIDSGGVGLLSIQSGTTTDSRIEFGDSANDDAGYIYYENDNDVMRFGVNGSERARIDSSGRLLVGTSTALSAAGYASNLQVQASSVDRAAVSIINTSNDAFSGGIVTYKARGTSVLQANDGLAQLRFTGYDGSSYIEGVRITAEVDGTPGANDMPGRLVFSVTGDGSASPTEAFAITNDRRNWVFDARSLKAEFDTTAKLNVYSSSSISTGDVGIECAANTGSARYHISFSDSSGVVGSISTSGGATAFNTSSDYRLKENVVPLTGAADRLNQLQVRRFNFIANPDRTVDGFIAHEAQAVVPECVTGTKDEVDDEGNPVYQGIDQSKLVPLLTAALQEALAEIKSLKARVTALEP